MAGRDLLAAAPRFERIGATRRLRPRRIGTTAFSLSQGFTVATVSTARRPVATPETRRIPPLLPVLPPLPAKTINVCMRSARKVHRAAGRLGVVNFTNGKLTGAPDQAGGA